MKLSGGMGSDGQGLNGGNGLGRSIEGDFQKIFFRYRKIFLQGSVLLDAVELQRLAAVGLSTAAGPAASTGNAGHQADPVSRLKAGNAAAYGFYGSRCLMAQDPWIGEQRVFTQDGSCVGAADGNGLDLYPDLIRPAGHRHSFPVTEAIGIL